MQVYAQDDTIIERWQWNDPALRNLSDVVVDLLRSTRGRVLDLGCGTGRLVAELAERGFVVDGIDVEEKAVTIGQRILARRSIPAQLYVGDVFDPRSPVARGGYDVVVCTEVLKHVVEWHDLLIRAGELLRPGGTLVVSVPRDPAQYSVLDSYAQHVRRFHDAELLGALRQDYDQIVVRRLGFPTMRTVVGLYTCAIHLLNRRHAAQSQALWRHPSQVRNHLLQLFYLCLKFDNYFSALPLGTTLVVRARKRPTSSFFGGS
jgi:SAM-dependent methyltransferase